MQHLSLKEKAYVLIKQKILNGDYEPGSRIMEDELAEEITMSRTPVREAINRLTAEGFVENVARKGIFFTMVTKEELKDLLELRVYLEAMSVKKCIDKIDKNGISLLEKNIENFKTALEAEDYKKCNELDSEFHRTIAQITQNKKLIKFLQEIEDFMQIARTIEKKYSPKKKNDLTYEDHCEVFEAIKNRDYTIAVSALEKNIDRMVKNLVI